MDELSANEAQELEASSLRWRPRQLAFERYMPSSDPEDKAEALRVAVRRPVSVLLGIFCFFIWLFMISLFYSDTYAGF